eukprot:5338441-Lingulodinium_polyedra.AAC.1
MLRETHRCSRPISKVCVSRCRYGTTAPLALGAWATSLLCCGNLLQPPCPTLEAKHRGSVRGLQ